MREDADKIVVDDEIVVEKNSISSIDFEIEKEINKTIYFEFKEDFYCYLTEFISFAPRLFSRELE